MKKNNSNNLSPWIMLTSAIREKSPAYYSKFSRHLIACSIFVTAIVCVATSSVVAQGNPNVWFNTGEDKVSRDEMRMTRGGPRTRSSVWDGTTLKLFGARNEVVSASMIIEAPTLTLSGVSVRVSPLVGPGGTTISAGSTSGNGVFNYVGRNIELFYVRYLQIRGLTKNGFEGYDERHTPERFRRPYNQYFTGQGDWTARPDMMKYYPDIAVPLELVPSFQISANENQSIWMDVFIPHGIPAGVYRGDITLSVPSLADRSFPIELTVLGFALPDAASSKTMLAYNPTDLNERYFNREYVDPRDPNDGARSILIRQRHFQMAHRHKITLVDGNYETIADQPSPLEWLSRLDGSLYTPGRGYDGPGLGTPHDLFVIGLFGSWNWRTEGQDAMWQHTNNWESWFQANFPNVQRFLYLIDEPTDYGQVQQWASWINANPGPGRNLKSFATLDLPRAVTEAPALDIDGATIFLGDPAKWQPAATRYLTDSSRDLILYNGHRPASGSFAIEDEGSSLRELPWGQYKMHIPRWFFWNATYYYNYINRAESEKVHTSLFDTAHTFGGVASWDPVFRETGWNYSNGDGVLFYPGSDSKYPQDSYGVDGPFASLRLKYWRRGIQDVDYVTLAASIDPVKTQAIVQRMVPKALWEYGVADPTDPTWQKTDISWSTDPDVWEGARKELGAIIAASAPVSPTAAPAYPTPVPAATAVRQPTAVVTRAAATATPLPAATTASGKTPTVAPVGTKTVQPGTTPPPTSGTPSTVPNDGVPEGTTPVDDSQKNITPVDVGGSPRIQSVEVKGRVILRKLPGVEYDGNALDRANRRIWVQFFSHGNPSLSVKVEKNLTFAAKVVPGRTYRVVVSAPGAVRNKIRARVAVAGFKRSKSGRFFLEL